MNNCRVARKDLISRRALERSANHTRRDAILASARVIYPDPEAANVAQ
ncbi:MAG: hypothetical protein N2378_06220 [Chloroflexaceae bacterium]|nr:hypothetical protein [Chloroflexaceae bacterium]